MMIYTVHSSKMFKSSEFCWTPEECTDAGRNLKQLKQPVTEFNRAAQHTRLIEQKKTGVRLSWKASEMGVAKSISTGSKHLKKNWKKNMDSRKYPNYQHTFVLIWKSMSMPWCCPWEREIHVRKHRWPVPWFPPKFGPTNWATTRLESCRSSCPSLPIIDGVVILKGTRSKGCQRGKWMQPSPKTCKVTSPILQILHCQESAFGITKRFSRTSFSWAADSLRWSKSKTNKTRTQNVIFAWSKTYSFHEIDQNTNLEYVEIHQVSWSIVWLKYVAVSATVPYLTLAFAHSCAKIAN